MTLNDIVVLLGNRITALNGALSHASAVGDIDRVVALEAEIAETQATLTQLQTLG